MRMLKRIVQSTPYPHFRRDAQFFGTGYSVPKPGASGGILRTGEIYLRKYRLPHFSSTDGEAVPLSGSGARCHGQRKSGGDPAYIFYDADESQRVFQAVFGKHFFGVWIVAIALHLALVIRFTWHFLVKLRWDEVFISYVVGYAGIANIAITSPAYGMQPLGKLAFWLGFCCVSIVLIIAASEADPSAGNGGSRSVFISGDRIAYECVPDRLCQSLRCRDLVPSAAGTLWYCNDFLCDGSHTSPEILKAQLLSKLRIVYVPICHQRYRRA